MNGDRKLVWAIFISFTLHIAIVFMGNSYAPWKIERSSNNGAIVIQLESTRATPDPAVKGTPRRAAKKNMNLKKRKPLTARPIASAAPDGKGKLLEQHAEAPPEDLLPGNNPVEEPASLPPRSGTVYSVENWKKVYSDKLRAVIEQNQHYPVMALRRKQQGTVMVGFNLDRGGRLTECHIVESCGHKLLDRAALRAVETVDRFPPFPAEFNAPQADFVIPVTFALRK